MNDTVAVILAAPIDNCGQHVMSDGRRIVIGNNVKIGDLRVRRLRVLRELGDVM